MGVVAHPLLTFAMHISKLAAKVVQLIVVLVEALVD